MKTAQVILGVLLFCNVVALGLELYLRGSDGMSYLSLFGSVIFGYYICAIKKP